MRSRRNKRKEDSIEEPQKGWFTNQSVLIPIVSALLTAVTAFTIQFFFENERFRQRTKHERDLESNRQVWEIKRKAHVEFSSSVAKLTQNFASLQSKGIAQYLKDFTETGYPEARAALQLVGNKRTVEALIEFNLNFIKCQGEVQIAKAKLDMCTSAKICSDMRLELAMLTMNKIREINSRAIMLTTEVRLDLGIDKQEPDWLAKLVDKESEDVMLEIDNIKANARASLSSGTK